jgi:dTDP-4-dehydrorhamnose 3,5-epimerase
VPEGCAHGFCVLSETAQVQYKCTTLYDPADEIGIAYDDPALAIEWPVREPVLSERDRRHAPLAKVMDRIAELELTRTFQ